MTQRHNSKHLKCNNSIFKYFKFVNFESLSKVKMILSTLLLNCYGHRAYAQVNLKHFEMFNFRAADTTKFAVYLMHSSVNAGTWRIYEGHTAYSAWERSLARMHTDMTFQTT